MDSPVWCPLHYGDPGLCGSPVSDPVLQTVQLHLASSRAILPWLCHTMVHEPCPCGGKEGSLTHSALLHPSLWTPRSPTAPSLSLMCWQLRGGCFLCKPKFSFWSHLPQGGFLPWCPAPPAGDQSSVLICPQLRALIEGHTPVSTAIGVEGRPGTTVSGCLAQCGRSHRQIQACQLRHSTNQAA